MAEPEGEPDLLTIAEKLYGLPLAEFTPARDARAKALKGTELAPRVKALRKPSVAAWVVNLLVRRETDQVDQVLAVGRALREAQQQMAGDQLRELTRQRRQLTAAVTTGGGLIAREAGTRVSESVAEQVEATLTAAMVDEQCALAVRSGLLVQALATTGIDPADPGEVAAAVALPEALRFSAPAREAPTPGRPDLRVVPDPEADRKAVAEAEQRLAAAESDVAGAEEELRAAGAAYDELEARSLQIQAELEELRSRISELESRAEQVDDELGDAEDARDEAADAAAAARSARDEAAAALERLRRG